jgi:hypothetical protein
MRMYVLLKNGIPTLLLDAFLFVPILLRSPLRGLVYRAPRGRCIWPAWDNRSGRPDIEFFLKVNTADWFDVLRTRPGGVRRSVENEPEKRLSCKWCTALVLCLCLRAWRRLAGVMPENSTCHFSS